MIPFLLNSRKCKQIHSDRQVICQITPAGGGGLGGSWGNASGGENTQHLEGGSREVCQHSSNANLLVCAVSLIEIVGL